MRKQILIMTAAIITILIAAPRLGSNADGGGSIVETLLLAFVIFAASSLAYWAWLSVRGPR